MKNEVAWVVIKGYNRYEASNTGLIRYRNTKKLCPDYPDGKDGYRKIKIYPDKPVYRNGKKVRKSWFVHRLIWFAFNGPIPPKHQIDHQDGIRMNNTVDNLGPATAKQNNERKKQRESNCLFHTRTENKKNKKTTKKRFAIKEQENTLWAGA